MNQKKHKAWSCWHGMRQRCANSNRADYKYYGGRGISVCSEWTTFKGFLETFPERPSKAHTLDRIQSDGNYCPANCRWATRKEQALNTSSVILIEGKSLSDWAVELGVSLSGMSVRYAKYGNACLVPNFKPNGITFKGQTLTVQEWASELNISYEAVRKRLANWPKEKALSAPKYTTRFGNTNGRKVKCG